MIKQKARKGCGPFNLSLTKILPERNSCDNNNNNLNILSNFSNTHLNELWLTAARLGEEEICRQIENIRFDRLEREREHFYEQHCN